MPATTAVSGKGTRLGYSDTANGAVTYLAFVTETNTPELSVESADATNYESPNDHEEKISLGWRKTGDVTFKATYDIDQTETLYSLFEVKKYWTELLEDGSKYTWYGWINKLGGDVIPNKGVYTQTVVMTNSGPTAFTAPA